MPSLTILIGPDGALVTLGIAVSGPRQAALIAAGIPIPPTQIILGLIDTGASCTCVDRSVIGKLGLQPTGAVLCHTPTTGNTPHRVNLYDISLSIFMDTQQTPLTSMTLPVIEADFSPHAIDCLIGRDVLASSDMRYNGIGRWVVLSF